MAQTYTLEEAAGRLALPTEEFKRRLKDEWKQIRSFRDGATLRFRAADIDELARTMGEVSDPGLQLGPVGAEPHADESDDFLLSPDPSGVGGPLSGLMRQSDLAGDSDFVLPSLPEPSAKVGKPKPNLKPPSDSDIKVEPQDRFRPADSEMSLPTEEIALDLSGPGSAIIRPSGLSGKLPSPKSSGKLVPPKPSPSKSGGPPVSRSSPPSNKLSGPPSAKIPGPGSSRANPVDGSSEFELSLDNDSDSFELQLSGDDSDEMDLGSLELGRPAGDHGGLSGINLGKPADSGLSLESKPGPSKGTPLGGPQSSKILPRSGSGAGSRPTAKEPTPSESDIDFELSLDADQSTGRNSGPKSQKMTFGAADSGDSEFELTLDDEGTSASALDNGPRTAAGSAGRGAENIQETDFELPAVDENEASDDFALDESATDENSDFDLAISDEDVQPDEDESASQVVLVDDAPLIDEDGSEVLIEDGDDLVDEDSPSASGALRNVRKGDDDDDDDGPVRTVVAAPARWGALPAVVMFPSLLLVFLGGLMSFELLRGMWGYHQPGKPSSMILRSMADTFGMKVND